MQKLPVLIPFDNQFEDTHTWNQNYIFEFIFSANVDAVNMNDAFVLAFCVRLTAKLQIPRIGAVVSALTRWTHLCNAAEFLWWVQNDQDSEQSLCAPE